MIDDPSMIARATIRCDRAGCRTYFRLDLETNQIAPREIDRLDVFRVLVTRVGWIGVDRGVLDLHHGKHLCPICAAVPP